MPKNIRFAELVALLLAFGFTLDRVSDSHHIFKHPRVAELLSLQEASNGQAKPYQIRQFLSLIETYGLQLEAGEADPSALDDENYGDNPE